jgi:preprotein translocase subunit SecF
VLQLLKNARYDFMTMRNAAIAFSGVLVLVSIVALATMGLNMGIEFAGGTEVQLKYSESPDIGEIRGRLGAAGLIGFSVTRIGIAEENEVYIRLTSAAGEGDPTTAVVHALRGSADASSDLNVLDAGSIAGILGRAPGVGPEQARELAGRILQLR